MRTLKLKHTEKSMGKLSMQHPGAKPGFCRGVFTIEITDIPDNVADSEVISVADETTFLTKDRYTFSYSEIGRGKIIR